MVTCRFFQDYNDPKALSLVRWTILIDTVNLSPEAKKVTSEDVEVLHKIEDKLQLSPDDRWISLKNDAVVFFVNNILFTATRSGK